MTWPDPDTPPPGNWHDGPRVVDNWITLGEIATVPVEFADKPFLQRNAFHLLAGAKAVGKGTWLAHIAARVTLGEFGEERNVLYLALGEDSYEIDVRPRVQVSGGDLDRVHVYRGSMRLPDGAAEIQRKAEEVGNVGLIIVDPVSGALTRTNTDEVKPALDALNNLAHHLSVIVIGVRNFSMKPERRTEALSAILGSSDFVNVPRMVLSICHDDVDPDARHLHVLTGNRVKADRPGIVLKIDGVVPPEGGEPVTRMTVVGESMKDPDELIGIRPSRTPRESKTNDAKDTLLRILYDAPDHAMPSDVLDSVVAEHTGLAAKTVRNLRRELGPKGIGLIRSYQERKDNLIEQWWVRLTDAGIWRIEESGSSSSEATSREGRDLAPPSGTGSSTGSVNKPFLSRDVALDPESGKHLDPDSRGCQDIVQDQLPIDPSKPDGQKWAKGGPHGQ